MPTKRKPKARHTVHCIVCGRGFEAANPNAAACSQNCRFALMKQREKARLLAGVDVKITPVGKDTRVDVVAPPEVWAMLEEYAQREGSTAHEIMGDYVEQSLLKAVRTVKRDD